ncbi:MAG: hypothetical protein C0622_00665 [Desulfuromonas sp.]|nr:MAG: hypothetical protein C0622_00665 [Desulfuromonas sp.]
MAGEISDWIALTAAVTSFIAYLEAKKANKTNDAIEALRVVIDASEETQTYLQKRAEGLERDRETEYSLAAKWSTAGFLMSRINKELSVRLSEKSRFWREPETWSSEQINEKNISLVSVTGDAKKLMESYA